MIKCYFLCVNSKIDILPTLMPIPRIGEKLFIEGQDDLFRIVDIQYQFKDKELILVNVMLKRKKNKR